MANWFKNGNKGKRSPNSSPPESEAGDSRDADDELMPPQAGDQDFMDTEDVAEVFGLKDDFSTPVLIRPGLFLGSVAAERSLETLQRSGITHVMQVGMSLRPRHPDALIYTAVRAPDSRCFDLFHALLRGRAFEFIDTARAMGGVLIHCAAGRSRSAAIAVAYIMRTERLSVEAALASVRRVRWICPNAGFQQQLELWEQLGCDAAAWPAPNSPSWPKQVAPRTPSPRRAPRRALDLTRLPAPRRAACELVRGADVAEEPRNDWAAYEASGLAPRPPRKALDMTREAFLDSLEQDFLAGAVKAAMQQKRDGEPRVPEEEEATPPAAPPNSPAAPGSAAQPDPADAEQAAAQAQAIADVWAQFAEVELPSQAAAPVQKPPSAAAPRAQALLPVLLLPAFVPPPAVAAQRKPDQAVSVAPGQQAPASYQVVASTRPPAGPRSRSSRGASGSSALQPPPKAWKDCASARERFDLRAALEAAGLRTVAKTGGIVYSAYPPVRFSFEDASGKGPTPIGIEYPEPNQAARPTVAPGQQSPSRISFSFDFPKQPPTAAAPLVRAF